MASTHFEGLLTTLFGYIIIAASLACLHCLMSLLHFKKYAFFLNCAVVVSQYTDLFITCAQLFMVALCNRADHYIYGRCKGVLSDVNRYQ